MTENLEFIKKLLEINGLGKDSCKSVIEFIEEKNGIITALESTISTSENLIKLQEQEAELAQLKKEKAEQERRHKEELEKAENEAKILEVYKQMINSFHKKHIIGIANCKPSFNFIK
jgi:endonuclease III-like uncharacterized protein